MGSQMYCNEIVSKNGDCQIALVARFLATTALIGLCAYPLQPVPAAAQEATSQVNATRSFDIPAQPLADALNAFGRQTGFQVSLAASTSQGVTSRPVHGSLAPQQALARMLEGTGVPFQITADRTALVGQEAAVSGGSVAADGSLLLDVIDVTAGQGATSVYTPYETAAPTAHISAENIERFRGSNPADIFRGTPGVMSGDARNAGSAVDVNIRGMQGMGRVNVTIDGAMNSTTVYQGYQGISNRTFVDPDFIAGVDITRGSDAASRGIAGKVAMRTLEASDIVDEGKTFGLRLKGEFGTNTSAPEAENRAGYRISNPIEGYGSAIPSDTGLDRPAFLTPTQGSGSAVAAFKQDNFDFLVGYAHRERGNYHAGKHGPHADPVSTGPRPFCYPSGDCPFMYFDYIENEGLVNYRPGEEVLNTQLETRSLLAKGTLRFGDGHALQLGYMWFDSEAGDRLASRLTSDTGQGIQQEQTVGAQLNTFTVKHRWQPADNDLVDLKSNFWYTDLKRRNPRRAGTEWSEWQPEDFGLPSDYRVGTDNVMWGGDITNTSAFDIPMGSLSLTYGLSYLNEDTRPSPYSQELEDWLTIRDGSRQETAAFVKGKWEATDWLTINGGLRYQHFWSEDRTGEDTVGNYGPTDPHGQKLSDGGLSPFIGAMIEPFDGTQFYVNYSNAQRMPSLFESLTGFSTLFNPHLAPERSRNWEVGTNIIRHDLFTPGDQAMLKLGYFNWDVQNYLAREFREFINPNTGGRFQSMYVYNIDRARFEGLELSARYERGGFTTELAANYYTNVEFCYTAETCGNRSLYGDYATNQIPPEYSISLTASQKLFEDSLTVGGRVSHVGPRAIGHGEVTAQGLGEFINQIEWEPYTLVDVFAEYKFNENLTGTFRIENLTDQFYVDPLNLVSQPGPGRTFYASLTAKF